MEIKANFKLPFKLPIKDELKLISKYHFANICTLFESVQQEIELIDNNAKILTTSLNITYFPNDDLGSEKDIKLILRSFIFNVIWYINRIIDAFRITFGLSYLRNITIFDLPTVIIIELNNEAIAYLTNTEFLNEDLLIITDTDLSKLTSTMTSMDIYTDIFLVDNFYESGKSYLYREDYIRAIIDLQTSFEIFIRNTYRMILNVRGRSSEELDKASEIPFRNVIEQELSKYLKENLKFNTQGPIKEWRQNLYIPRNNIVHSGIANISGKQANLAVESYEKARNFISDLLIREGFLSKEGRVNLNLFKKNDYYPEIDKQLINFMKEKKLIPEEFQFIE